ncbi:MAG: magnesium transporter [Xanthomonadales bacterium]|nr:magnesium transporter [Xanthomonadales bacterium]
MAASLAGAGVPLTLRQLGFDPARASSIFPSTVADLLGFLAFLELGSLLPLRVAARNSGSGKPAAIAHQAPDAEWRIERNVEVEAACFDVLARLASR